MRMQTVLTAAVVSFTLAFLACGREKPRPAAAGAAPAPAAVPGESGHASAGVTPGSYEDWCEEHGVQETLCTRCDASLAAAFKATSDWCAEHGLPESQCLQCNPDLKIVRPPKPEAN